MERRVTLTANLYVEGIKRRFTLIVSLLTANLYVEGILF